MSNSAVCPVIISEEQQIATLLEGFTLPLKMVLGMDDDRDYEATLDMDGTVFDYTLQKSWPNALAYVRHHRGETVTAQDAMRLLSIGEGSMADTTLWQIRERHPGFLQDAGLTPDQIEFRNCVSSLPVPIKFTVIDAAEKEHEVTLCENHLFSSKWDHGMSAQEVCRIFKDWKDSSPEDAMSVLYYTDSDGKEWRLSEIVALSPFRQKSFPAKPTESQIIAELNRYIDLIATYDTVVAKADVTETLMEFLLDECVDFMTLHPAFRLVVFANCDKFITSYPEFPDLVARCKCLAASWEHFTP